MIGDWTNEHPTEVQRTLLRMSDWYSFRKGTTQSLLGAYHAGKLREYLTVRNPSCRRWTFPTSPTMRS